MKATKNKIPLLNNILKLLKKSLSNSKRIVYSPNQIARVAQLVELQPSKLTVAGSSPVSRSKKSQTNVWLFLF